MDVWRAGGTAGTVGLARASEAQLRFRAEVGPFFWQSAVLKRCWEKPRGYAGDFLMMEALYRHVPAGESPLGLWLDTWALDLPGFQAVRNRRDMLSTLLREEHARGARRVMNVASGSAPELAAVAREVSFDSVTLMDQDQGALDSALAHFHRVGALPATRLEALRLWCGSVLALLRNRSELERDSQDFLYSIGLYDYLTERFARSLTTRLWAGVAPGGLLVLGNFNADNPMLHFTESALDWYLVYRSPTDMLRLVEGLPGVAHAEVRTEDTGCLHLLLARKAG
ncbi:class I SAM-dependent methyltransferase [Stigmatella ashevillensis]|uniref:class I SAM-dependent methyltransferase n=1 Tax=Stigmatella ashevillensis TaxID=2995309 RepID=UPI0023302B45|nr:class I SAM-dependent methyltransferase [Stigmatella ashevillena]